MLDESSPHKPLHRLHSHWYSQTKLFRQRRSLHPQDLVGRGVKVKPEGSPFKRLLQVVVAAFRKGKVDVPEEAGLLYHNMELDAPIAGGHQTRCGRASSGAADGPTPR
ncbi:hypothetical protein PVAP13_6KG281300 [Panicum virgatum]|uniref:Uncharacterized protein n=1 Tax=Panicum virgatum TaxID=38727 RepID=A0A8T0RFI8_PANVG|nr:hypothetical protein PVAP13_6KG281300 [Panicum virgatum]